VIAALVVLAVSPVPAESRQLVLAVSEGWDAPAAVVRRYERAGPAAPWTPVGPGVTASLGRSGLGWGRGLHAREGLAGPVKREGDGRAPAGVFELSAATGYAAAPPGTKLPYTVATSTLRCVDDPASAHYNRLVDEARVAKDWSSAEEMRRADDLYRLVVWVGHNDAPPQAGDGSCIFLHLRRAPDATTAGCTAFDEGAMEAILAWLDPLARPVLVQLPRDAYRALAEAWRLP
jgi:L,D-peptidoglycan transpeptidase YkuD (ErfK/YbiS/YcfS/YnhG family)